VFHLTDDPPTLKLVVMLLQSKVGKSMMEK
jgi:hypothetical protein